MTKAEERALEAYPHYTAENLDDVIKARKFFVKGYEQAEKDLTDVAQYSSGPDGFFYGKGYQQAKKDLELTWEDVYQMIMINSQMEVSGDFDISHWKDYAEEHCKEVLKKFNETRK